MKYLQFCNRRESSIVAQIHVGRDTFFLISLKDYLGTVVLTVLVKGIYNALSTVEITNIPTSFDFHSIQICK